MPPMPPPGMPPMPGIPPPAPPCAPYAAVMIGLHTSSMSFFLASYSSNSALGFASTQSMVSLTRPCTFSLSSSLIRSLNLASSSVLRIWYATFSRSFLAWIVLRFSSSSALYFSASATILLISSSLSRPLLESMVILLLCDGFFLSLADTDSTPLASKSKVTSTCGTPRGAGGMPISSNLPSWLLSLVSCRSPSYTWISTPGWLSAYVVNVSLALHGIVLLRSISFVITPPAVSMPSDSGVTANSSRSPASFISSPLKIAACTAAPYATASSGLIDLHGSLPLKYCLIKAWIRGIRVEPPTNTTSWTSDLLILASW